MAPAGVPDSIIEKINADLRTVLSQPDVIKKFETLGTYPHPMSPRETSAFLRAERDLWWPIVRKIESEEHNKP